MIKLATPISHLFEDKNYAKEISKLSDCLECRDRSISSEENKQELFHCELQPIHKWSEKEFNYLSEIKDRKKDLRLITFHAASSCDEPILVDSIFQVGGNIYTKEEMLLNAKKNIEKIKKIFGSEVLIAIENNNFYDTPAYENITDASFISELVYENNIYFLFDIAHAKVTSYNKNINFEKYKESLPLDKLIQVHICSYAIDNIRGFAYDAHNYPDEEELIEVEKIINKFEPKYLTVEYYRDIDNLVKSLERVRKLV